MMELMPHSPKTTVSKPLRIYSVITWLLSLISIPAAFLYGSPLAWSSGQHTAASALLFLAFVLELILWSDTEAAKSFLPLRRASSPLPKDQQALETCLCLLARLSVACSAVGMLILFASGGSPRLIGGVPCIASGSDILREISRAEFIFLSYLEPLCFRLFLLALSSDAAAKIRRQYFARLTS